MDTSAVADTSGEDTLLETSSIAETEQSMNDSASVISESTAEVVKKRKRGRPPLQQQSSRATKKKAHPGGGGAGAKRSSGEGLYGIVLAGKSALQSVASEWVDRYHDDPEAAMLELVQYFVQCSGCKATITAHMFHTQEASTVIRSLTENFAEESVEYPLISGGVQAKKFKANFSELIERLVVQCQHSVLCDEYMLDTLVMWLVGLTDSPVRAFRHTCTLACLKLTTAVVHVATTISTELDSTQRQADSERRRSASKRVSGKLQKLDHKLNQLEGQLKDLQEVMNTIFSSVFVHRYRDNRPEIRALCIAELGVWMRDYGVVYLNDHYLKYIGWTLYDKSADVRAQSVISLQPLYSTPDLFPHLELFIQKFKDRLVTMRLDKEETVAVNAITLCSHLFTLDMLEEEDCVEICELVFTDTRGVAHAAGSFAVQYLFSEDFMSKTHQSLVKRGKKKATDAQIMLKEIVHFFIDANVHHHAVYLVDSLWDHATVLRDWETMTELLLDSSCVVELTAVEEKALIEVMACAVRKAAGGGTALRGKGKAVSARERRVIEQDKEEIATKLIPCLPDLISKYGTESDCAINLSAIPQHFDLEMYVELRAQKHLENLLVHLKDLVMKHNVTEVLDECACTFHHLLDADFSLHSTVNVQFGELCDELFTSCRTLVGVVSEDGMVDEESEDVYNLSVILKRISEFYKSVDLTQWQFSDHIMVLLDAAVDANCSDLLAVPAISCLKMHVLWVLKSIDEDDPNREALRTLRNISHHVIAQNIELVQYSGRPAVQREAFFALCDLLIVFSTQLHNHGALSSLVYTSDQTLQSSMCEYVMHYVIGEEEEEEPVTEDQVLSQAESLNDKRVLLAGFLKLIIYGVFDTTVAAPVFASYVKNFLSYGDLIKMAVTRSRETNPLSWYRTILLSLQQLYTTLLEDRVVVDYQSPDWADIKDLAHRFVLTLGFDYFKYRLPLVGIHRDGIKYALSRDSDDDEETGDDAPPNLPFFDILSEFSFRLVQVDKTGSKGVLTYLKEQLGEGVLEKVEEREGWEPLHRYVVSMIGEDKTAAVNTSRVGGRKRGGKGTKRKGPPEEASPSSKTVRAEE